MELAKGLEAVNADFMTAVLRRSAVISHSNQVVAQYRTAIELMSTLIRGSRIEVLSGQQHNAMDTAPELFAETMINFLK